MNSCDLRWRRSERLQENWGSEGKRRRLTALFLSFRKPITFYALITRLHRCNATGIDQLLRIAGEIHANVTQALLAAAGVVNLFGVDADRFAEAACTVAVIAADRTRAANFFSHVYYLQTKIEATSVSIYSEIFRGVTLRSPSVPSIQGDFRQRGMGLLYTSIQTPPAVWLRTQASTKRTPSTPSSTVGKVSVVFSRPALRSESTLQNER